MAVGVGGNVLLWTPTGNDDQTFQLIADEIAVNRPTLPVIEAHLGQMVDYLPTLTEDQLYGCKPVIPSTVEDEP